MRYGPAAEVSPTSTRAFLLSPNPFSGATTVRYTLDRSAPIDLAVYDSAGRLVRRLASRSDGAGEHAMSWNGRDDDGRPAASGIYHVRLTIDGHVRTQRVVRVR
jgi:flagellar hook assembly protein FlgD